MESFPASGGQFFGRFRRNRNRQNFDNFPDKFPQKSHETLTKLYPGSATTVCLTVPTAVPGTAVPVPGTRVQYPGTRSPCPGAVPGYGYGYAV